MWRRVTAAPNGRLRARWLPDESRAAAVGVDEGVEARGVIEVVAVWIVGTERRLLLALGGHVLNGLGEARVGEHVAQDDRSRRQRALGQPLDAARRIGRRGTVDSRRDDDGVEA